VFDYQWTDDIMTYVQAATGSGRRYHPGRSSRRRCCCSILNLTTYELGLKTDFAEHRVRVNVAAFFNKYEDIILRLNRCPGANPTPCQLPANVGSADVKGIELESSMLLGSGISIDLAASWLDFQYTETDIVNTSIPID
jgi:iron complex outermembrane receptor protein